MHKELSDALLDVETIITELITSYENDFHDGIENTDFAKSEDALHQITYAADILPGSFPEGIRQIHDELRELYNEEIQKYAQLPLKVTAWDNEIVNNDLGSIEMFGVRSSTNLYELFVKLTDGHAKDGSNIKLNPQLITKNG